MTTCIYILDDKHLRERYTYVVIVIIIITSKLEITTRYMFPFEILPGERRENESSEMSLVHRTPKMLGGVFVSFKIPVRP